MKRRDDRHAQVTQKCQDVASRFSTEYSVLELEADQIDIINIEEVSSAGVRKDVFLGEFKANPARIRVAGFRIVDRQGNTRGLNVRRSHRLAQIRCKRGDAALPRKIVADECNSVDC